MLRDNSKATVIENVVIVKGQTQTLMEHKKVQTCMHNTEKWFWQRYKRSSVEKGHSFNKWYLNN